MDLTPFAPLKLLHHTAHVRRALAGEIVYPISVEIDLSNICNHHCPWCSYNGFRQENWTHLDAARALTLIDELADVGVKSITFTGGGEPLVHARAADLFLRTHDRGIEFGVVTNGRRLEGGVAGVLASHAKFVRVSLDAGTAQTHQLLHGTAVPEYERILSNLLNLRKLAGPQLTIGASFCVFDTNYREIVWAARNVRDAGAHYLEVRPVFPTEWRGGGFGNPLTADVLDAARDELDHARRTITGPGFRIIGMIQRFDQVFDKSKAYAKCRIGPITTVINADGKIYHCCQQRGMPAFVAGSILDRPFKDVWLSAEHRAMMDRIEIAKCPACRYDGYNEIIEHALIGDAMHANFI